MSDLAYRGRLSGLLISLGLLAVAPGLSLLSFEVAF